DTSYRQFFLNNRTLLTLTLAALGDHDGAGHIAQQLAAFGWNRADDPYNAACALAQCIPIAEKDAQLAEAKRQELGRSYADRALAMLRQAIRNGYEDAAHMKQDTDLDALRTHPEFQKLLAELESKAKPVSR